MQTAKGKLELDGKIIDITSVAKGRWPPKDLCVMGKKKLVKTRRIFLFLYKK